MDTMDTMDTAAAMEPGSTAAPRVLFMSELLLQVFAHLDRVTLARVAQVCRTWHTHVGMTARALDYDEEQAWMQRKLALQAAQEDGAAARAKLSKDARAYIDGELHINWYNHILREQLEIKGRSAGIIARLTARGARAERFPKHGTVGSGHNVASILIKRFLAPLGDGRRGISEQCTKPLAPTAFGPHSL